MIILGIETSCDETAAAVLEQKRGRIQILSNIVASSAALQAKYGGIIPEQAAREQIKSIILVIEEVLQQAFSNYQLPTTSYQLIDAIAVTQGPGLIGSLLVGVETAKVLAQIWQKPLIPINHLLGHFYANWIARGDPKQYSPTFPCLGLLVSGGHTDLVLFKNHHQYKYLGGTRDDAAGECFDKCARLLGLPYPGGPEISQLAQHGDPQKFKLPIPLKNSQNLDFSYSGLKTAVSNLIKAHSVILNEVKNLQINSGTNPEILRFTQDDKQKIADLAASIEETIVKSLVEKVVLAIQKYQVDQIMVAGGVAANQKLVYNLQLTINNLQFTTKLHIPPPYLCTDNGAMIASRAFFEKKRINPFDLQADPNLSLAY